MRLTEIQTYSIFPPLMAVELHRQGARYTSLDEKHGPIFVAINCDEVKLVADLVTAPRRRVREWAYFRDYL